MFNSISTIISGVGSFFSSAAKPAFAKSFSVAAATISSTHSAANTAIPSIGSVYRPVIQLSLENGRMVRTHQFLSTAERLEALKKFALTPVMTEDEDYEMPVFHPDPEKEKPAFGYNTWTRRQVQFSPRAHADVNLAITDPQDIEYALFAPTPKGSKTPLRPSLNSLFTIPEVSENSTSAKREEFPAPNKRESIQTVPKEEESLLEASLKVQPEGVYNFYNPELDKNTNPWINEKIKYDFSLFGEQILRKAIPVLAERYHLNEKEQGKIRHIVEKVLAQELFIAAEKVKGFPTFHEIVGLTYSHSVMLPRKTFADHVMGRVEEKMQKHLGKEVAIDLVSHVKGLFYHEKSMTVSNRLFNFFSRYESIVNALARYNELKGQIAQQPGEVERNKQLEQEIAGLTINIKAQEAANLKTALLSFSYIEKEVLIGKLQKMGETPFTMQRKLEDLKKACLEDAQANKTKMVETLKTLSEKEKSLIQRKKELNESDKIELTLIEAEIAKIAAQAKPIVNDLTRAAINLRSYGVEASTVVKNYLEMHPELKKSSD